MLRNSDLFPGKEEFPLNPDPDFPSSSETVSLLFAPGTVLCKQRRRGTKCALALRIHHLTFSLLSAAPCNLWLCEEEQDFQEDRWGAEAVCPVSPWQPDF